MYKIYYPFLLQTANVAHNLSKFDFFFSVTDWPKTDALQMSNSLISIGLVQHTIQIFQNVNDNNLMSGKGVRLSYNFLLEIRLICSNLISECHGFKPCLWNLCGKRSVKFNTHSSDNSLSSSSLQYTEPRSARLQQAGIFAPRSLTTMFLSLISTSTSLTTISFFCIFWFVVSETHCTWSIARIPFLQINWKVWISNSKFAFVGVLFNKSVHLDNMYSRELKIYKYAFQ